jgi:recombination protein U
MIYSNLGMYAEEIVNRTKDFFKDSDSIYIEKREIPIKIIKHLSESNIIGKLCSKSFVDYFGIINGQHIEFEVKQTNEHFFQFNLLKEHQYKYLTKMSAMGIKCYLIIYFSLFNTFVLVSVS